MSPQKSLSEPANGLSDAFNDAPKSQIAFPKAPDGLPKASSKLSELIGGRGWLLRVTWGHKEVSRELTAVTWWLREVTCGKGRSHGGLER